MKFQSLIGGICLSLLVACNFQDYNYHSVDLTMSQYADANAGSWWKYRDSLGTATDSVVVTRLSNTFTPLGNESDKDLYQTIVMSMKHFPSLKNSQVVISCSAEANTLSYTDTSGNTYTLLTKPSTNSPITVNSVFSGKYLFNNVLEFTNLQQTDDTLYVAKGYWIVKHTFNLGQNTQNWIVDTLAIK
jgi:hypothetical protein